MFGGYYSFQHHGVRYPGRQSRTLPVIAMRSTTALKSEGFAPPSTARTISILKGSAKDADPARLQRGNGQAGAEILRRSRPIRLAAVARRQLYGKGRTVAWTSDVGLLAAAEFHRLERLQDAVRTDACLGAAKD